MTPGRVSSDRLTQEGPHAPVLSSGSFPSEVTELPCLSFFFPLKETRQMLKAGSPLPPLLPMVKQQVR